MQLLDGNKTSKQIKEEIKTDVAKHVADGYRSPHLAAVLVGSNPASQSYVNYKIKDCKMVGFKSTLHELDDDVSENDLLILIDELNRQEDLDGYIVQLPLPKHINENKIIQAIDPIKDADGFHPTNLGKMVLDLPTYLPATPYGIMEMLDRYDIDTNGKNVVVLGRSNIVGRPISILLSQKGNPGNATVTLCHSRTENIKEFTLNADIIIVALGVANFLTADMVSDGAVIVDVGINRVEDNTSKSEFKLIGDVDFDNVKKKASYITPVPGGVGPMTRAMLLKNTLQAYKRNYLNKED